MREGDGATIMGMHQACILKRFRIQYLVKKDKYGGERVSEYKGGGSQAWIPIKESAPRHESKSRSRPPNVHPD